MMNFFIAPSFLYLRRAVLVTITLFLSHCIVVKSDAKLIEQTCKNTPFYTDCVSYLESKPGSSRADVQGLGVIMVGIVKDKATETLNLINQELKRTPGLKAPLSSCAQAYKNGILAADVPEATEAMEKGNPKFAENGMNDSANETESCEEGFQGKPSPVIASNKVVHVTSAIAAAIAHQ
ncbi:hypothetical protein K2173_018883 [Erythroxylum novogranatense]|uniref:Pectinesterase inhibitor domain-containing protein n=1 Tax=Erythroxylum novogranatense TaxID=1862640 RepID=A0AAV8SB01_9ROSI|nr:hypothetical protein K2173_018883 [Erythroxylum novogranatense]